MVKFKDENLFKKHHDSGSFLLNVVSDLLNVTPLVCNSAVVFSTDVSLDLAPI